MKSTISITARMPMDSMEQTVLEDDMIAVVTSLEEIKANVIASMLSQNFITVTAEVSIHLEVIRCRMDNLLPGMVVVVVEL